MLNLSMLKFKRSRDTIDHLKNGLLVFFEDEDIPVLIGCIQYPPCAGPSFPGTKLGFTALAYSCAGVGAWGDAALSSGTSMPSWVRAEYDDLVLCENLLSSTPSRSRSRTGCRGSGACLGTPVISEYTEVRYILLNLSSSSVRWGRCARSRRSSSEGRCSGTLLDRLEEAGDEYSYAPISCSFSRSCVARSPLASSASRNFASSSSSTSSR